MKSRWYYTDVMPEKDIQSQNSEVLPPLEVEGNVYSKLKQIRERSSDPSNEAVLGHAITALHFLMGVTDREHYLYIVNEANDKALMMTSDELEEMSGFKMSSKGMKRLLDGISEHLNDTSSSSGSA